jgi:hypothetical protein
MQSDAKSPTPGKSQVELDRTFNHAATALELLYDAANGGSEAAREVLRDISERLASAANRYHKEEI